MKPRLVVQKVVAKIKCLFHAVKPTVGRLVVFLLVAVIVYGASGIIVVPPNSMTYLYAAHQERFLSSLPYVFTPGVWWVYPTLMREEQATIRDFPTTDDFIRMALYYDSEFDALVDKGELHNPRNDAEVEAMAATIVAHLRTVQGPFFNNFEFNGVSVFTPNPQTPSKYDVEIAHWAMYVRDDRSRLVKDESGSYIPDNSVYVNRKYYLEMLRKNTDSFFAILTHELVHGALAFTLPLSGEFIWDQETLNQVVTAQMLYGMAQEHIPGAAAAFMEHMRDLALYSAKYRAYFAQDVMAPTYYGNLLIGAFIREDAAKTDNLPTVWQSPEMKMTVRDLPGTVVEILKGNPYGTEYKVNLDPFPLMNWAKQNMLLIRQNGIHIRPYTIIKDAIGYHKWWADLGRKVFGQDFVYMEWAPLTGEKERLDAAQTAIFERAASPEYEEKWKYNNAYFADVWYRYSYGAMMTLLGHVNYGIPIKWFGTTTSDFNDLLRSHSMWELSWWFAQREIVFDTSTWEGILSPLMLEARSLPAEGLCVRVVKDGPCVVAQVRTMPYGTWRMFPSIPLAFGLLLILDALALRKWGTRRKLARRIGVRLAPVFYVPAIILLRGLAWTTNKVIVWRGRNK